MSDELDTAFYKTLLESTLAIPWKINWETKKFTYVGPQIESLLGWKASSWKTAQDWIDRMHPEDRDRTSSYCISLSEQGQDHEADYRAQKSNGEYVWIRDVVHVIREAGATVAIIGFMFDISERKRLEIELIEANKRNEELLRVDSLTGIANRMAFEEKMNMEFKRALRSKSPLSVLLIDVDYFKKYNDNYGHFTGDKCLVTIAETLINTVKRHDDLVARIGGEEFVVILPDTNIHNAVEVAELCRTLISDRKIPHEYSSVSSVVTVSIGVNTMHQEDEYADVISFLKKADNLLYKAKTVGRNRVVYSA